MTATDKGNPPLSSQPESVIINVLRNNFPPEFTQNSYTGDLNQNVQNGASVIKVSATDRDVTVSYVSCHMEFGVDAQGFKPGVGM